MLGRAGNMERDRFATIVEDCLLFTRWHEVLQLCFG